MNVMSHLDLLGSVLGQVLWWPHPLKLMAATSAFIGRSSRCRDSSRERFPVWTRWWVNSNRSYQTLRSVKGFPDFQPSQLCWRTKLKTAQRKLTLGTVGLFLSVFFYIYFISTAAYFLPTRKRSKTVSYCCLVMVEVHKYWLLKPLSLLTLVRVLLLIHHLCSVVPSDDNRVVHICFICHFSPNEHLPCTLGF